MRGQALKRIVSVALASLGTIAILPVGCSAQERPEVTKADVDRWSKELSNWGRWGKDDQIGTLNLITPETRKRAAALVKEGVSISLSRDLETKTSANNPTPLVHKMILPRGPGGGDMALDSYEMNYHGLAYTHLDALCHVFPGGKLYNGFSAEEITTKGAAKESILNVKGGVFTRGILIDIPRLKGVPYLEPGTHIYPADLEAWEKKAGIRVGAGDAILIRTGRWARVQAKGPWDLWKGA
ncbi:cyclase family protein, partial [Singulisphaera rosea]